MLKEARNTENTDMKLPLYFFPPDFPLTSPLCKFAYLGSYSDADLLFRRAVVSGCAVFTGKSSFIPAPFLLFSAV